MSSRARSWLPGVLAVLLAAITFAPGLSGGFFFDDYQNIVTNPLVQTDSLDLDALAKAAKAYQAGPLGRPMSTITFAVDHYLWGKDPFGYKATSLAVHAVNTFLVFTLVRLLLAGRAPARHVPVIAALSALAWACHPLQVSTVLYVVQRMESLAATFVFLALISYVKGRQLQQSGGGGSWRWIVFAVLLAAIGVLAKEVAVLAIPLAWALELALLRFRAASPATARTLRIAHLAILIAGVVLFFFVLLPRLAPAEAFEGRHFTQSERILTQFRVLPLYLWQILVPVPDNMLVYYDHFQKSEGLFSPWTTAGGAALLVVLLGAGVLIRNRAPLAAAGIFWFFAGHSLTSGPFNLELVFEHRNYLPLLGIVLVATDLVLRIRMRDGAKALGLFACTVVLAISAITAVRAAVWGDPLVLASDLVAKNPDSARASNDLATIYVDYSGGDPDSPFFHFAIQEFERGSKLPHSSPLPEQGLILTAAMAGRDANPEWWDRILHKVRTQPIGPEQYMAVTGLLKQYKSGVPVDRYRLAELYQALLDRRERWPGHVYASFADFVLSELNDSSRAKSLFVAAVTKNPHDDEFAQLLLGRLIMDGRTELAKAVADAMLVAGIDGASAVKASEQ